MGSSDLIRIASTLTLVYRCPLTFTWLTQLDKHLSAERGRPLVQILAGPTLRDFK